METTADQKPIRITAMIRPDHWRAIRRQAIEEGTSGSEILRQIMDDYVSRQQQHKRQERNAS